MAYYNKIALLILNDKHTKFLVCEPAADYASGAKQFLLPGGTVRDGETPEQCLQRKVPEELGLEPDTSNLRLIGEYTDVSAANPNRDVSIKLYQCVTSGQLSAYNEFKALHWIGRDDISNERVSPIIRNKIISDLIDKQVLT